MASSGANVAAAVGPSTYSARSVARPRVLLVSNVLMHYRVSVYNYMSRRFDENGFEFAVITDRIQSQNQRAVEFELAEVPFSFRAYAEHIRRNRPAAVILFLHLKDRILWPLLLWLKYQGIPVAFWTKGGNWDAADSRWRRLLFDFVHARSDALILYSESCRRFVRRRLWPRSFVANNTVNFDDFPEVTESKDEIRGRYGLPFPRIVLFVGRMETGGGRKRVDHLIDIFRGLDRSDVGLVLVGSGLSQELRDRINPANTRYLGEVHDPEDREISRLFRMADVCAIPGHVGLGLNQAFYWGLPVVTEDCNQPPEIGYLKDGRNGFIVPCGAVAELKKQLLRLLDDDELRERFSKAAREDILRDASMERMFQGFRDCIRFLAGEAHATDRATAH